MRKYLRKITALLPKRYKKLFNKRHVAVQVRLFLFVFLVLLAGVLLQILVVLNAQYVKAQDEFTQRREAYRYWTGVASQFPSVPDILYNAAVSSIAIQKRNEALLYVKQALLADPLFEKARILEERIRDN